MSDTPKIRPTQLQSEVVEETKTYGNAVAVGLLAGAVIARRMHAHAVADAIEREGRKHASWLQSPAPDPAGEAEYLSWLTQLEMTLWDRTLQEQAA